MGIFDKIKVSVTQRAYRQELREAAKAWDGYLQNKLAIHRDKIAKRRVLISNDPWPGTREVAMILEHGLIRIGAMVVTNKYDSYDNEIRIWRYSGTDAAAALHDSTGNEIMMEVTHHQEIVAKAVYMSASQK